MQTSNGMKLTIIGSGTMMPTKKRNPSAFLLEAAGRRILLDCGLGTIRRLVDMGINPQSLDALGVTHFHIDHVGDAFNLVQARFVDDIYAAREHKQLILVGPESLKKRFLAWRDLFWLEPTEKYPLVFHEGQVSLTLGDMRLETFPVTHVPWFSSVGYKITSNGKILLYPGDIGSHHNPVDLISKIANADLLLIEAAAIAPVPNHLTIEQVIKFVEQAYVRKTLIIHIRPDRDSELERAVSKSPYIELAQDGIQIEL